MNNLIKRFTGNSARLLLFTPFLFLLFNVLTLSALQAYPGDKGSHATWQSYRDLPPGSAPAIAKAMLKDLPEEYQLRRDNNSFSMSNPSHGMDIAFTPEGLQVTSAGKRWGMVMTGIGTPGSVQPVEKAMPVNDNGMMVYARGDVSEWYINSPWGVEQGFTIESAPGGRNGDGLVVELSLSGELRPGLDGHTLVMADAQGRSLIRYTDLQVFDVVGRSLPAHLILAGNALRILVDDTHAKYPVTIDPWIQQAKLKAVDGVAYDYFGFSVAISGDTIVVGAPYDDDKGTDSGSAYVFTKPAGGWIDMTQTAKLTAGDGAADDLFGLSVAISGDTIVAGAYGDDDKGLYSGSAYVFTKPAGGWADMTQTAKLTAGDGTAYDRFGYSVAVSGNTIVAGAYGDDDKGLYSGSAYVFTKPASGWADMTQTAKLTAGDGTADDRFGYSVAVSGNTIVAGAYGDDDKGSAHVFAKPAGGWVDMTQTAKLTADDGAAYNYFGYSVAVSGDTIVVGAYGDDDKGLYSGSAYVFAKPASGWGDMTQTAKLTAGDGAADDCFGDSVAVSGDTIVVGADGFDDRNSAYVFAKPAGGWVDMTQTAKLTADDGAAYNSFAYSVAISGDTIVVGDYDDDVNGECSGSAYFFEIYRFPWPMFMPAINKIQQ